MPALVHLDVCVAAFHRVELGAHVARRTVPYVPVVEIVWRAHEHDRHPSPSPSGGLWPIDVGRHAYAVAHWYHDLAIDDGQRLELLLLGPPLLNELGVGLSSALRGNAWRDRGHRRNDYEAAK